MLKILIAGKIKKTEDGYATPLTSEQALMREHTGFQSHFHQATIPSTQRRCWQRDEGKCVNCGSQYKLEFDHVIPVADGGSSTERNIQLLCESCNRRKGRSVV